MRLVACRLEAPLASSFLRTEKAAASAFQPKLSYCSFFYLFPRTLLSPDGRKEGAGEANKTCAHFCLCSVPTEDTQLATCLWTHLKFTGRHPMLVSQQERWPPKFPFSTYQQVVLSKALNLVSHDTHRGKHLHRSTRRAHTF